VMYVEDGLYRGRKDDRDEDEGADPCKRLACESFATHLFEYRPGWTETVEYRHDDPRLPAPFREFAERMHSATVVATPLRLGNRTLGWMTVSSPGAPQPEHQWGRVALIEAMARHAALALHHNRVVDNSSRAPRHKALVEE